MCAIASALEGGTLGFSIRQSIRVGPLRLNLSKSGLGASVGVRGFRLGTGPRGSYVRVGGGGVFYSQSLGASRTPRTLAPVPDNTARRTTVARFIPIASDGMSPHLEGDQGLTDINHRLSRHPWAAYTSVFGAAVVLLWSSPLGALVVGRSAPTGIAAVLGATVLFVVAAALYARFRVRNTTALLYDLDAEAKSAASELWSALDNVRGCSAVWNVGSAAAVTNPKYHAGAGELVERVRTSPSPMSPRGIRTNVTVMGWRTVRQTLYFLPDKILVWDRGSYCAVRYGDTRFDVTTTRFVEAGRPPRDAEQVGTTWQHPNKAGGPDRRFKENRQIPVMRYGEIRLQSDSGLNALFQTSRPEVLDTLAHALGRMADVGCSRQ